MSVNGLQKPYGEAEGPQTMSRIQNWYELSDIERERTVRLLVKKRNVLRMEKIKSQEQQEAVASTEAR